MQRSTRSGTDGTWKERPKTTVRPQTGDNGNSETSWFNQWRARVQCRRRHRRHHPPRPPIAEPGGKTLLADERPVRGPILIVD